MGIFEPITHSEETRELLKNAESLFNCAKSRYEDSLDEAQESIETLGKVELNSWGKDIHGFITVFSKFANAEESKYVPENSKLVCCDKPSCEMALVMKNTSIEAKELLKLGTLAIGTSVIAGIAAYGAISTLSKGTAIAASGIAAKSGIALSAASKSLLIGGAVVAPLLIFGAIFANIRGKKKLAEAKRIYAEAKKNATDLDLVSEQLEAISSMSHRYEKFINKIGTITNHYIEKMQLISNSYQKDENGMVDYNLLLDEEKKTLHVGWLLACTYSTILKCPILNNKGKLNKKAQENIINCKHDLKIIQKQYIKEKKGKGKKVFLIISIILLAILGIVLLAVFLK